MKRGQNGTEEGSDLKEEWWGLFSCGSSNCEGLVIPSSEVVFVKFLYEL